MTIHTTIQIIFYLHYNDVKGDPMNNEYCDTMSMM